MFKFKDKKKDRLKDVLVVSGLLMLTVSCADRSSDESESKQKDEPTNQLFQKISSTHSNVTFSNDLQENVETYDNLFNFDYFYNGAGVGLEDINNDGLLDIFFSGNQVPNRLYLNLGDFKFKDISESAGINEGKVWSNGVTFVDINNDGWQDIYISQGGPNSRTNRHNLLYINNQDGTFTEEARTYGLADSGISTQSAFFDYDGDGDLDCIVMNENELYGLDPISLLKAVEQSEENQYYNSSHFYKNENGNFSDVTKEVGLENPIFGLGLSVSDINLDGYLDIYITSDYYLPDALYLNNGDGTFSDKIKDLTQQISFYGMGIDIADINNDNLQDIFVLDMASSDHIRSKTLMASMNTAKFDYLINNAGFHYQYMYNSLQLNLGNDHYSNIAQLTGTANTDWSWSVLLSDYDNDGFKDIFVTNGYRKYALDNDFQKKVYDNKVKYKNNIPTNIKQQLYDQIPSEKLKNLMYKNNGNLDFNELSNAWGLDDLTFSNGAAQGDLDNDGDLDLVINNLDQEALIYDNQAVETNRGGFLKVIPKGKLSESFAKVTLKYDDQHQFLETKRGRGYMSSQENTAHFGLGKTTVVDTVSITWANGKTESKYNIKANSTITFSETDATDPRQKVVSIDLPYFKRTDPKQFNLDFKHQETNYDDFEKEILLPYKQSTTGPYIAKGDINADGREDIYIGGGSGQPGTLFIQTENGFVQRIPTAFDNDKLHEDAQSVFFDIDGDNDLDLYVVSGGNEFPEYSSYYTDRIYLNDGFGNFTRQNSPNLAIYPKSGRSVTVIDFDDDGDMDVLVGNRIIPQNYPKHSPSVLYENIDGQLVDVTADIAPQLETFGIINCVITTDFNNDGRADFIAVGEWTSLGFFENQNGKFQNIGETDPVLKSKGWWYSAKETDINNDGKKDYIIGNFGRNLKFSASESKPFKVFANDFDNNGVNDIVLSKKYNETYVPVRGRECSSQQMPFIKEKFSSYTAYANASLTDIYGDKLEEAYEKEVTEFNSILLVNQGNGKFEKVVLPIEAQLFPTLAISLFDLNNDGFEDCILAGNIYETEVETPRLDGISGLALISNGVDGYIPATFKKTGLFLKGNIKSLETVTFKDKNLLLSGSNNGPLETFLLTKN